MTKRVLTLGTTALASLFIFGAACGGDENNQSDNTGTKTSALDCSGSICTLTGDIAEELTLKKADGPYLLKGGVFVGSADGSKTGVLTIEPGTIVYGEEQSFLAVGQGSRLEAAGTKDAPIVFTSAKDEGSRAAGDWGGLIINGRAPLNTGATAEGEGGTGVYGGDKADDNSGTLEYVRVEFGGYQISDDNELNGIAFQGVGSGTTIEHVQVHRSKDDGIEFFGGTAQAKYILVSGIGDDNLDWTDGWQGKVQFFAAVQYGYDADNGIEADNNGDNNTATPVSSPTISNVTLVGRPASDKSDLGMLIREGTQGKLFNVVVTGFNDTCLSLDQDATFDNVTAGTLTLQGAILNCPEATTYCDLRQVGADASCSDDGLDHSAVQTWFESGMGNEVVDPLVAAPAPEDAAPALVPAAGSPALSGFVDPGDSWFKAVDFRGAVGSQDWTAGWTAFPEN